MAKKKKNKKGRKPLSAALKKIELRLYSERFKVDALGGKEATETMLIETINQKSK